MFISKSRLSKMLTLALLSATLVATVPAQAGIASASRKAVKAALNVTRVAGVASCAAIATSIARDTEQELAVRIGIPINCFLFASMIARDIYNDYAAKKAAE